MAVTTEIGPNTYRVLVRHLWIRPEALSGSARASVADEGVRIVANWRFRL